MNSYGVLAEHYDGLMPPAGHEAALRHYLSRFKEAKLPDGAAIIDLACGTGTIALALARLGYDLTGIDPSPDMLSVAARKSGGGRNPMWLCQSMQELDLNDTADAAVCCFDGVNYLDTPGGLRRALRRIRLFLKPRGVFLFDVITPQAMADMDGETFSSESDTTYCTWRPIFTGSKLYSQVDLFVRDGSLWRRHAETHVQRAYGMDELSDALREAGFDRIRFTKAFTRQKADSSQRRWSVCARKAP